jgi:hypothetical protein
VADPRFGITGLIFPSSSSFVLLFIHGTNFRRGFMVHGGWGLAPPPPGPDPSLMDHDLLACECCPF